MPFSRHAGFRAALLAVLTFAGTPPAHAQGFFQSLFGAPAPRPSPARPAAPPLPQVRYMYPPSWSEQQSRVPEPSTPRTESGTGHYRTLCVRLCDGYYWPINQSASRSDFHRDARSCSDSCGTEARLFYHPNSAASVDGMVDLTGRAYARLPTAFRYRKTLVAGCQCKAAPWSESEIDRHRRYAVLEGKTPGRETAVANSNQGIVVLAGAATPRLAAAPAKAPEQSPVETETVSVEQPRSDTATPPPEPQPAAPPKAAFAERRNPEPAARQHRSRVVERASAPVVRSAAYPAKPLAPKAFGLGAGGVRWPGD